MFVEDRENVEELFKKDIEVITYENIEDLIYKIKFYLNKMDVVEKIALNGHKKTMNRHTTFHRAVEIEKNKRINKLNFFKFLKSSFIFFESIFFP